AREQCDRERDEGGEPGHAGQHPEEGGQVHQAIHQPSEFAARYAGACWEPRSSAVLAHTSAARAVSATTDTSTRSDTAGHPVRGSIRWWKIRPPMSQRRRRVALVAAAWSLSCSVTPPSATGQPSPEGPGPRANRSPPRL